jgi:hypothetical protein
MHTSRQCMHASMQAGRQAIRQASKAAGNAGMMRGGPGRDPEDPKIIRNNEENWRSGGPGSDPEAPGRSPESPNNIRNNEENWRSGGPGRDPERLQVDPQRIPKIFATTNKTGGHEGQGETQRDSRQVPRGAPKYSQQRGKLAVRDAREGHREAPGRSPEDPKMIRNNEESLLQGEFTRSVNL